MKSKKPDNSALADPGHLDAFESLHKAWQELRRVGYRIGKTKLYDDAKKGAFKVRADGSVLETEIRAYAATLSRQHAGLEDLNDVHKQKAERDVKLQDIKIEKMQLELEKEQGKFIPRQDFEAELAARAVIFDNSIARMFDDKAREWIALVGGKPEKTADFIAELNDSKNDVLSEYATMDVFQVMFQEGI